MLHIDYDQLTQWLHNNPTFALAVIFIFAFSENIAIIGLIMPGMITMTIVGLLIGSGAVPLYQGLIYGITGAFIGDSLSYLLGLYLKDKTRKLWPFTKHPELLDKGKKFFLNNGIIAVFIGRFLGPIRLIVPLVAGALHLKPQIYFLASIPGNILWVLVYIIPGFLVGAATLEMPSDVGAYTILLLLGVMIAIWIVLLVFEIIYSQINLAISDFIEKQWLSWQHDSRISHFICNLLRYEKKNSSSGQIILAVGTISLFIIFAFLCIAKFYFHASWTTQINMIVYHFFRGLRTETLDKIMPIVTSFGDVKFTVIISLAITIGMLLQKYFRAAIHFAFGTLLANGTAFILKHLFSSARPPGILYHLNDSSFPSGHTIAAITMFGLFAFFISRVINSRAVLKILFYSVVTISISVIFSRLYLNAHWITDVLGSILLGSACLSLIIISYRRHPSEIRSIWPFVIFGFIALCFSEIYYINNQYQKDVAGYSPHWQSSLLSESDWWNKRTPTISLIRKDRFGKPKEIMNLEWAGHLPKIVSELEKNGWKNIHSQKQQDYISILENLAEGGEIPRHNVFDKLFNDQPPVIRLSLPANACYKDSQPIELNLWRANITLLPKKIPLWQGIVHYRKKQLFDTQSNDSQTQSIAAYLCLYKTISDSYTIEPRMPEQKWIPRKLQKQTTQNQIILIKPIEKTDKP